MKMIRQFTGCIREFKRPTVFTLLCMVGEVAIEVLIPFYTADLINEVKAGAALDGIVRAGLILVLMALVSLGCGAAATSAPVQAQALPATSGTTYSRACRTFRLKTSTGFPPRLLSRA